MTFDEYQLRTMLWCPKSDHELFDQWTKNVPPQPPGWPGGATACTVNQLRMAYKCANPVVMLEIGFNLGASSSIWMNLGVERLLSVDINNSPLIHKSALELSRQFIGFRFMLLSAKERDQQILQLRDQWPFDAIYIDGGHDSENVRADIALARNLRISKMIFDDFNPHFGPAVLPEIIESGIKIVGVFGNCAYCEDPRQW